MKAAFHYLVKAKVIKKILGDEPVFSEISKVFENENPLIAREEAFRFYQSWIDILLESKEKKYLTDIEARKELMTFIDINKPVKIYSGEAEIEFNESSIGNGVGVFFVPDKVIDVSYSGRIIEGDELLIHGIGNFGRPYMIDDNVIILSCEAEYYKHFKYETNNKEIEINYCFRMSYDDGWEDDGIKTRTILPTPFDWTGYDKPFWWGKPDTVEEDYIPKTYEEIIEEGESNKVEFKSTLLYNLENKGEDRLMKEMIAKTICSFLNSNGGILFIGINDNGSIIGLDSDFNLSKEKKGKDFFQLKFDEIISQYLGFSIKSNLNGQFYIIEGKQIFIVVVEPSKKRPIFLITKEGKKFYVRGEASSRHITDIEEIIKYCLDRFV